MAKNTTPDPGENGAAPEEGGGEDKKTKGNSPEVKTDAGGPGNSREFQETKTMDNNTENTEPTVEQQVEDEVLAMLRSININQQVESAVQGKLDAAQKMVANLQQAQASFNEKSAETRSAEALEAINGKFETLIGALSEAIVVGQTASQQAQPKQEEDEQEEDEQEEDEQEEDETVAVNLRTSAKPSSKDTQEGSIAELYLGEMGAGRYPIVDVESDLSGTFISGYVTEGGQVNITTDRGFWQGIVENPEDIRTGEQGNSVMVFPRTERVEREVPNGKILDENPWMKSAASVKAGKVKLRSQQPTRSQGGPAENAPTSTVVPQSVTTPFLQTGPGAAVAIGAMGFILIAILAIF